jgi:predicted phage-related endonuclease
MSDLFTIERYENRADWLRARKRGLGASDAAPVLGMSRWRGGYSVATDKLTEGIDESPPDETQEWGLRHEPAIAQKFAEVMKWQCE